MGNIKSFIKELLRLVKFVMSVFIMKPRKNDKSPEPVLVRKKPSIANSLRQLNKTPGAFGKNPKIATCKKLYRNRHGIK